MRTESYRGNPQYATAFVFRPRRRHKVKLSLRLNRQTLCDPRIQHANSTCYSQSTGGIISLGFGHELWSVDECIQRFTSLVSSAFTLRPVQNFQGLKYVEQLIKRSKYRTRPFEEALRSVLSDSVLFAPGSDRGLHKGGSADTVDP